MRSAVKKSVGVTLALAFVLRFCLLDAVLRGSSSVLGEPRGILAAIGSAALWAGLLGVCERRALRALVAIVGSTLCVVELQFFRHYHSFLDLDAALAARRYWSDVAPVVVRLLPAALAVSAGLALLDYFWLSAAKRPSPRATRLLAPLGVLAAIFVPHAEPELPDLGAVGALRVLFAPSEARAAGRVEVPALDSTRRKLPSVLLILNESVRASDYRADTAPETAALLPRRISLRQLRTVGSYTAISANALLSGRVPLVTHDELIRTPLVFDYVHSVRSDGVRPRVLFWSAQADSLFERTNVRDATDSWLTLEDLVGHPVDSLEEVIDRRVDELLAVHVAGALPRVEPPFFLMLQLSGTHAPYFVDDAHAPFSPYTHAASWSNLERLHNAYLDAIVAQDSSVAKMLRAFLARVGDTPWIVIFTSDHGEAFGEHKAIHHGQNTYDEQIHVPGFIAFGNGALDSGQERELRAHADDFLTELDLLPTILDAYGVWQAFALSPYRPSFAGRSLLRTFAAPPAPVPVTNCSALFPCPLRNWGVLGGRYEILAQAWDAGWRCVDLGAPDGTVALAVPECNRLVTASRQLWPTLPNGRNNR